MAFCRYNLNIYIEFEIRILVFNATFSNISDISWRPVLVVEEAEVPGENHRPWASRNFNVVHISNPQLPKLGVTLCLRWWGLMMFNVSYMMAVSSIGGGNKSTRLKLLACRKSVTNFIT